MPTIKGFSTKNKKEMMEKLSQAGVAITLPFSGKIKTNDKDLKKGNFKDKEGNDIIVE